MTVLSSGQRKGRKVHNCSCCKQLISKEQEHYFTSIANDGTVYTWRSHKQTGHCGTLIYDDGPDGTFCEICMED